MTNEDKNKQAAEQAKELKFINWCDELLLLSSLIVSDFTY